MAFSSSRMRTTVPSRMSRIIGSSVSERAFQPFQSPFTFRQIRLTPSLPTSPAKAALSARRTRRVLVPARLAPAIKASADLVRLWRLAILAHNAGARHGDLGLAERGSQRALAVAMPAGDHRRRRIIVARLAPP